MNGQDREYKRFILDTNAIVSLLKGNKLLVKHLEQAEWIGISIISKIEFLAFQEISESDISLFEEFLARVDVIDLKNNDEDLLTEIINIRKSKKIKLPDAIIASTALCTNATLVTADNDLLKLDGVETLSFERETGEGK